MELSKKEVIDEVTGMLSITSGKLAVKNHYCITRPSLRDQAAVLDDVKKKKVDERITRVAKKKTSEDEKFKTAATTYFANGRLRKDDLMILVKRTQLDGDSPIKNLYGDLKAQFERRRDRMNQFDYRTHQADEVKMENGESNGDENGLDFLSHIINSENRE
jgi:hypothetical protein